MSGFSRGLLLWDQCASKSCSRAFFPYEAKRSQYNGLQKTVIIRNSFIYPREFATSTILHASKKKRAAQKLRPPTPRNLNKNFGIPSSPTATPAASPKPSTKTKPQSSKVISPPETKAKPSSASTTPSPQKPTTILPYKAKPSTPVTTPKPSTTTKYTTYLTTLSEKTSPTPLYEAPAHTPFILTCTALSSLSLLSGAYIYYVMVLFPPAGLAGWVSIPYIITSFSLFALATWIGIKPLGMIKSLTAIPQHLTQSIGGRQGGEGLKIEVQLRRTLPFLSKTPLLVAPSAIVLPKRPSNSSPTTDSTPGTAKAERENQARLLEYEHRHIMTMPIRKFGRSVGAAWRSVRRRMSEREGFLRMEVGDRRLKLDREGWMLDKGKAFDRLFATKL